MVEASDCSNSQAHNIAGPTSWARDAQVREKRRGGQVTTAPYDGRLKPTSRFGSGQCRLQF